MFYFWFLSCLLKKPNKKKNPPPKTKNPSSKSSFPLPKNPTKSTALHTRTDQTGTGKSRTLWKSARLEGLCPRMFKLLKKSGAQTMAEEPQIKFLAGSFPHLSLYLSDVFISIKRPKWNLELNVQDACKTSSRSNSEGFFLLLGFSRILNHLLYLEFPQEKGKFLFLVGQSFSALKDVLSGN